jgi:hypothetical protein
MHPAGLQAKNHGYEIQVHYPTDIDSPERHKNQKELTRYYSQNFI